MPRGVRTKTLQDIIGTDKYIPRLEESSKR